MYNLQLDNNVNILWDSNWVKSVVEMCIEHYAPYMKDTCMLINSCYEEYLVEYSKAHPNQKIILYNLEHKYPIDKAGRPQNCTPEWETVFKNCMGIFSEVWDFNIENQGYFKNKGWGDRWIFKPLRYTTWFEQFHKDTNPQYDIQLEMVVDTQMRFEVIYWLCQLTTLGGLTFKLTNHHSPTVKYMEKLDAHWGLDVPHYDTPETINAFRIWECICMDRPVLCWDKYNIGSRMYFPDGVKFISNFQAQDVFDIIRGEQPKYVAQKYKELTYSEVDYQKYIQSIVADFENKGSGATLPPKINFK